MRSRTPLAVALLLASGLAPGCGPKVIRETVYENEHVGDAPVPLGNEHPATIADVRLAHILATLQYRREADDAKPAPAIRTEHLYDLSEGISKALARATPDDVVVAWSQAHDRRMVVFSDAHVTAMRVAMREGRLWIDFYAIEAPLDNEERRAGYEPPVEVPYRPAGFRLVPDTGLTVVGPRTLDIDWRDPYFRKPLALRSVRGRLRRRTVIMRDDSLDQEIERELEAEEDPSVLPIPPEVTDAQIRALDELDGARRAGLVTEGEFKRRRRLILQGRLDEAGYGSGPE
jgi:hypothetical protein